MGQQLHICWSDECISRCLTFPSLRICDLQVAVCGLETLPGHNLPFKLVESDMEPIESDCIVVQFGRKLIVNTRHFYRSKHLVK